MVNCDGADPTSFPGQSGHLTILWPFPASVSPTSSARRRCAQLIGPVCVRLKNLDSCVAKRGASMAACGAVLLRQYSGRPATSDWHCTSPPGVPSGIKGLPCLKTSAGHGGQAGACQEPQRWHAPRQPRTASHALKPPDPYQAPPEPAYSRRWAWRKRRCPAGRPHTDRMCRAGPVMAGSGMGQAMPGASSTDCRAWHAGRRRLGLGFVRAE